MAGKAARDCRRSENALETIGGGSGTYCIATAKEHAGIRAVVLDLPVVCEVTREFIAENGVAGRVEAQPCDFTRDRSRLTATSLSWLPIFRCIAAR